MAVPTWTEIRDNAMAALNALLVSGVAEYTVGGSTFTKLDIPRLTDAVEIANAHIAESDGTVRSVVVEFQEGIRG